MNIRGLKPGTKIKLKPLSEVENKSPGIVGNMEPLFGGKVTINEIVDDDVFRIQETGGYTWHKDWIDSLSVLPEHLFEI